MSRTLIKLLALLLVLAVTGCSHTTRGTKLDLEYPASSRLASLLGSSPAMRGKQPPDVVLTSLDGKVVRLRQLMGKQPTILLFSSTTCPYSTQEHVEIDNAMKRLKKRAKVVTVLVNGTSESAHEAHFRTDAN